MAYEVVRPLKLEDTASGGVETDEVPKPLDPNEDAVDVAGIHLQNDSSSNTTCLIERTSGGDLRLNDGVSTYEKDGNELHESIGVSYTRAPTYSDTGYDLGTFWYNSTTMEIWRLYRILSDSVAWWMPIGSNYRGWSSIDHFNVCSHYGPVTTSNNHHWRANGSTGAYVYVPSYGNGHIAIRTGNVTGNYTYIDKYSYGIFGQEYGWYMGVKCWPGATTDFGLELGVLSASGMWADSVMFYASTAYSTYVRARRYQGTTNLLETSTGVTLSSLTGARLFEIFYVPSDKFYWYIDGAQVATHTGTSMNWDGDMRFTSVTKTAAYKYLYIDYVRAAGFRF